MKLNVNLNMMLVNLTTHVCLFLKRFFILANKVFIIKLLDYACS